MNTARQFCINAPLFFLLGLAVIIPTFSIAQTDDPENRKGLNISNIQDITTDGFNFWQENFSGHFAGIDFGFNSLLSPSYSTFDESDGYFMENDFIRSNSVFFNIIQQSFGLQNSRNTLGIVTGIGIQLQSYRLDNNTTLEKLPNSKIVPEKLFFDANQKSKLSSAYLIVPVLFEFQIPMKNYANRTYFSAGVYAGLRLSSHTKIKYRVEGKKEKLKTPDDFSLQNFKTGFMARLGYRWMNVFATYDISPLFIDGRGPGLTPFTIGFTFLQF